MKKRIILVAIVIGSLIGCKTQDKNDTFEYIAVENHNRTVEIPLQPKITAILERGTMENLIELDVPFQGMAKAYSPSYLQKYVDDKSIVDVGAVFKPNFDAISRLAPDLIIMDNVFPHDFTEMIKIGPTLVFGVPEKGENYVKSIRENLLLTAKIFDVEEKAEQLIEKLDSDIITAKEIIAKSDLKAMFIIHTEGAFRLYNEKTKYGFVFNDFGVKNAAENIEIDVASNHGHAINSEFILEKNPDILFVIDRDAIMNNTNKSTNISNPLLNRTNAFKNNKVIYLTPDAWFLSGSGLISFNIVIQDILKAYK